MKRLVLAAVCGLVLASGVAPDTALAVNGFTPNLLLTNPSSPAVLGVQDIEPSIRVDSTGRVFVTAIRGVPAGQDLFQVDPSGLGYLYRGQPDGLPGASGLAGVAPGGGDTDLTIGSFTPTKPGPLTITSLNLATVFASQTSDAGMTYTPSANAAGVSVGDDRQWNASQGGLERYDVVHDLATDSIMFTRSMDGGLTWINGTPTTLSIAPVALRNNNIGALVVDQGHGILYNVFVATASSAEAINNQTPTNTRIPNHTIWVAKSTDDGQSWTDTIAFNGPTTESYGHLFPTIATDYVGNVYVGWCDGKDIFVTYSTNGAQTFAAPTKVTGNIGDPYQTHIFPWLAAAGNGGVDLTYYASTNPNSNDTTAQWVVGFSQNLNVPRQPSAWTSIVASDHIVHTGQVCQGGVGCATGGNRRLSDDFQVAIDPAGYANIAFTDDHVVGKSPVTYFTKQMTNSLLPPATNNDGEIDNYGCSEDGTTDAQPSEMRVKGPGKTSQGWLTLAVGPQIIASGPLSSYHPTSETSGSIAGRTVAGTAFVGTITNGALDLTVGTRSLHFAAKRRGIGHKPFAVGRQTAARARADGTSTSTGSCHLED